MRSILHRSRWLVEPAVAILFFVFWAVAEVGRHQLAPGSVRTELPFWAALLLLSCAVGLSRLAPIVAMAAATVVLIGQLLVPTAIFGEPLIYLGYLVVILGVAATTRGRMRAVALAFAAGAGVAAAGLLSWWLGIGRGDPMSRTMFFILCGAAGVVAWSVGVLIGMRATERESREQLERLSAELRVAEAEAVVAQERERVAQDVHDIMAHSLAVILAQSEGARLIAGARPRAADDSLTTISETARSSLTEVRVLIESLVGAPEESGRPGLAELDGLVERLNDSGLTVTLERFGRPVALSASQELAVYRIVQEALTNALKHAGAGAFVRVALDQRDDGVSLSIASRPPTAPPSTPAGDSEGRGLIGMRERARLAGGWLDAGADDDVPGGYLVTAYVPAAPARAVRA